MSGMIAPVCPYCNGPSELLTNSAPLYNGHNFGPVYLCAPCYAWVGCHPGTVNPVGRLANKELRKAKQAAHAAFDPLWKAKIERDGIPHGEARARGYRWLAQQLGVAGKDCHIGMFDVEQCRRVVDVCEPYKQRKVA
jgi:zinc-finger-containing domain